MYTKPSNPTLVFYSCILLLYSTLVFYRESRRDSKIPPPNEKLPRVNASRFQSGATCMHVVKLKRIAMQPWWKCVAKSIQCVIGVQVIATSTHQRPVILCVM
jgi:hypothetical protein